MIFKRSEGVEDYIQSEVNDLLELEEDCNINDVGIIIFLRKAGCSVMTKGGWKEVACTVEFYKNYNKKYKLMPLKGQLIHGLPIYIEQEALKLLNNREIIELEIYGSLIKELKIKDAPVVDLGPCVVEENTNDD